MKLRLDLRLSQKLVMTPQLQQAIKLLQLSRLELQQTISQNLLENPLLEEEVASESESNEEEQTAAEESPAEPPGTSDTPDASATSEQAEEGEFSWEEY